MNGTTACLCQLGMQHLKTCKCKGFISIYLSRLGLPLIFITCLMFAIFAKSPFSVKLIHLLRCSMIKTNANVAV